jgi:hypothetical protein
MRSPNILVRRFKATFRVAGLGATVASMDFVLSVALTTVYGRSVRPREQVRYPPD